jgi:hypothetical protein
MNSLGFDRLILRFKRTSSDDEKVELLREVAKEAAALADSLKDPVMLPFEVKTDGSY